jgi:hypothetical protein
MKISSMTSQPELAKSVSGNVRAQACDVAPRSRQRQDRFQQLLFGEHAALGRGQCQFVRP